MADDVTELTYEGPPASAGRLAQILRDEGLTVSYAPPEETRHVDPFALATVVLSVTGPVSVDMEGGKEVQGASTGCEGLRSS
jgi:hypothetical protein